jgi:hypothetical protein
MSQEQLKIIAELTLQNDESIDELLDMVLELRNLASASGWKVTDAQQSKVAAVERAKHSVVARKQRAKLRKFLDLG